MGVALVQQRNQPNVGTVDTMVQHSETEAQSANYERGPDHGPNGASAHEFAPPSTGRMAPGEGDGSIEIPHAPLLIVLSGPSGVGKTTVTKALVEQGWPVHVLVTVTTRRPRPGESNGVHYHFTSPQEFHHMIERGDLLEYAEVHGNWYGVPVQPVRDHLAAGHDVILTIDPQGAQTIRQKTSGALYIFMAPEQLQELVERVNARDQDSPEQRTLRLLNAEREMSEMQKYDYLLVNRQDHLSETVERVKAILLAEHSRVHPRTVTI